MYSTTKMGKTLHIHENNPGTTVGIDYRVSEVTSAEQDQDLGTTLITTLITTFARKF